MGDKERIKKYGEKIDNQKLGAKEEIEKLLGDIDKEITDFKSNFNA